MVEPKAKLLISPPLLQSTQPFGRSRLTWLKTLKAWNWNWVLNLSVKLNVLKREKSVSKSFGPRMALRPMLPKPSQPGCPHGPEVAAAAPAQTFAASDPLAV